MKAKKDKNVIVVISSATLPNYLSYLAEQIIVCLVVMNCILKYWLHSGNVSHHGVGLRNPSHEKSFVTHKKL